MFCFKCGTQIPDGDKFCNQCGACQDAAAAPIAPTTQPQAAQSLRDQLLTAVQAELAKYPMLTASRSDKTDLEIKSVLADANWGIGKKKVEYSACLLAKESERTVIFWEMIKESGSGMEALGGFKTEGFFVGKTLSGKKIEKEFGPTGKVVDYNWDYAKTRKLVEAVVKNLGWQFKTVILPGKARY